MAFNTTVKQSVYENNTFTLTLENKNKELTLHTCDALLYATGREANSDTLHLENTSIELTSKNYIKRNEFFLKPMQKMFLLLAMQQESICFNTQLLMK